MLISALIVVFVGVVVWCRWCNCCCCLVVVVCGLLLLLLVASALVAVRCWYASFAVCCLSL